MITLLLNTWVHFRQALSLSLAWKRPITIGGGADFLVKTPALTPIFNDIKGIIANLNAGEFTETGGDLIFTPGSITFGRHRLETGPFSSGVEAALFLMPALFFQGFRSVLTVYGVTHPAGFHSTGFVKEALLPVLEGLGFYASLSLKRFGFHGSGEGEFEMRIYPHEIRRGGTMPVRPAESVAGARIFIAGMNLDLAARYRDYISRALGVSENLVSILEIRDAAGMGCAVQVYLGAGRQNHVLYRNIPVYNAAGDLVFDEAESLAVLDSLAGEAKSLAGGRNLPDPLVAETLPWLFLSGGTVELPANMPLSEGSLKLCEAFSR